MNREIFDFNLQETQIYTIKYPRYGLRASILWYKLCHDFLGNIFILMIFKKRAC